MLTILKHFLLTGIDGRKAIRRIAQPQPEGLRSSGLGAAPQSPQNTESVFWKRWRIPAATRFCKSLMDGQRPSFSDSLSAVRELSPRIRSTFAFAV